jgi:DNA-binding protein HU-beta
MLKSEFVTKIAEKTGLTKKDVVAAVDAYNETVVEALKDGDSVPLKGFGTFTTSTRKTDNGETVSLKFNPSKAVKDAINEK